METEKNRKEKERKKEKREREKKRKKRKNNNKKRKQTNKQRRQTVKERHTETGRPTDNRTIDKDTEKWGGRGGGEVMAETESHRDFMINSEEINLACSARSARLNDLLCSNPRARLIPWPR